MPYDDHQIPLTRRQREIVNFISDFIRDRGYSPTLEEIGQGLGLSSLATIHKHLKNLEQKGLIRRRWNHSRSIQLLDPQTAVLFDQIVELPLLGRVAAGRPIEAVLDEQTLGVPRHLAGGNGKQTYVLQVEGDSMIEEHITDGDFVIVESRETALPGETVVALVEGESVTVKKYYPEGSLVRLQPANAALAPIMVQADQVRIQGVVIGLMRRYQ